MWQHTLLHPAAESCLSPVGNAMEKYYSFSGVDIAVEIPDDRMYSDDRELAPFRVESIAHPHRFRYQLVDTLTPPSGMCVVSNPEFQIYQDGDCSVRYIGAVQKSWKSAYIRASHRGWEHQVELLADSFPKQVNIKTVLNSIMAEHLIIQNDGILLHSSYLERQGKGILFTAPSGTGKSTQAALWERLRGAEVLNGDRAGVRMIGTKVFACGVPFSGSSGICKNRILPLSAVVYLKQASVTSIRRLQGSEAFRRIWEGCSVNTWDEADVKQMSETVLQILSSVPVFELSCTPDESAIIALEGVLNE